MTVIAAAIGPDGTWMAADGLRCLGSDIVDERSKKINVSPDGRWAFAGGGDMTADEILFEENDYVDVWPTGCDPGDPEPCLRTILEAMRTRLRAAPEHDLMKRDAAFSDYDFAPVVATDGHIWRATSGLRFCSGRREGVYQATGCGDEYAMGAMSSLVSIGEKSAEVLVTAGVAAACRSMVWCGGEMQIVRLNP